MKVTSKGKFIRISPRKVRLVVDLIRGLDLAAARLQLSILPKRGAGIVLKVLNSAAANAEHNNQLKAESLYVAEAFVDQGPTLKRFTAKAFGRGATIRKRTSHITLVLSERQAKIKADKKTTAADVAADKKVVVKTVKKVVSKDKSTK